MIGLVGVLVLIISLLVLFISTQTSGVHVRRDYLKLSDEERNEFHRAVLLLKESGEYDNFTFIHVVAFSTASPGFTIRSCGTAHNCAAFGPWHRAYLFEFEAALQRVSGNPDLTLPYWDWLTDGRDGKNPLDSLIWTDDYMGGDGDITYYDQVYTGPFANWSSPYCPIDDNPNQILQRTIGRGNGLTLPTDIGAETAMLEEEYDVSPYTNNPREGFRSALEGPGNQAGDQMHNAVHPFVGGTMLRGSSPGDPVFFLHHCFIDLLWNEWQQLMLQRTNYTTTHEDHYKPDGDGPQGQNIDDQLLSLGDYIYTPRDVLDVEKMGYQYQPRTLPQVSALDQLFMKKYKSEL